MGTQVMESESKKPFVLLKTKRELLQAKYNKQLVFGEGVEDKLGQFNVDSVLAAKVTLNSPTTVIEVDSAEDPQKFLELVF